MEGLFGSISFKKQRDSEKRQVGDAMEYRSPKVIQSLCLDPDRLIRICTKINGSPWILPQAGLVRILIRPSRFKLKFCTLKDPDPMPWCFQYSTGHIRYSNFFKGILTIPYSLGVDIIIHLNVVLRGENHNYKNKKNSLYQ